MFADGNIRLVMDMESWEKIGRMAGWVKSSQQIHKLTTRISGWKLDRYPMLTFEGTVTFWFTDGHPNGRDDGNGPEIYKIDPVDVNAVKARGKIKIDAEHEFWPELESDLMSCYSNPLWNAMLAKADRDRLEMMAWDRFHHQYDEESGDFDLSDEDAEQYDMMFEEPEENEDDGEHAGPKDPRFPDL